MFRISPQGGVEHVSIPHPEAKSPCLISFRFHLFGLIRSFQWDKRDPYFEHNKLPQAPSQDLCPQVLNKCCPLRNASGSEIVVVAVVCSTAWIPASETLALQHSSSSIPDMHPATRKCPASKGETGVSSGLLIKEFCEPLLHLDVSFAHQRAPCYLWLFIADPHLSKWFSSALPRSCLLLSG